MSIRNGELMLSYARTAGTADQPVPGTVTSRRDRDEYQKQKMRKEKRDEENRILAKQQEAAARFLKRKWKEEDREERRRRRHNEQDRPGERPSQPTERSRSVGRQSVASSSAQPSASGEQQRRFREAQDTSSRGSGWERVDDRPPSPAPRYPLPSDAPRPSADDRQDGPSELRRPRLAGAAAAAKLPRAAPGPRALGFGVDDDEEQARKERQLAEASLQQRARRRSSEIVALAHERQVGARPSPRPTEKNSSEQDAFLQLKGLADWKRSCQGARRAMPKEMEDMVGSFAEKQSLQPN